MFQYNFSAEVQHRSDELFSRCQWLPCGRPSCGQQMRSTGHHVVHPLLTSLAQPEVHAHPIKVKDIRWRCRQIWFMPTLQSTPHFTEGTLLRLAGRTEFTYIFQFAFLIEAAIYIKLERVTFIRVLVEQNGSGEFERRLTCTSRG